MSFTYEIISGKLFDPDGKLIAIGYSGGNKGLIPSAINNPEDVALPDIGPIPPGKYIIRPPENDPKTGPFSMPLSPDMDNQMFGRDGFRMHGDNSKGNRSASEGCIIMPRTIRESVWATGDRELIVVAQGNGEES